MKTTTTSRWETFWRHHPRCLLWAVLVLTVLVTLSILFRYQPHVVLYETF
jgi:hypothetical protein